MSINGGVVIDTVPSAAIWYQAQHTTGYRVGSKSHAEMTGEIIEHGLPGRTEQVPDIFTRSDSPW